MASSSSRTVLLTERQWTSALDGIAGWVLAIGRSGLAGQLAGLPSGPTWPILVAGRPGTQAFVATPPMPTCPCPWPGTSAEPAGLPAATADRGTTLTASIFSSGGVALSIGWAVDSTRLTPCQSSPRLLHDGGQVFHLHRILGLLAGTDLVLRTPGGRVHQVVQPDLARSGVGLVHHDDARPAPSCWSPPSALAACAAGTPAARCWSASAAGA